MKIGFIDYYLDEWHANNYPEWIKEASGGEMTVEYAFAETASPHTGVTTEEWCSRTGITQVGSIEELVEKSDAIVVLSPDNCERHEMLSRLPLLSGKPVYIDKTFAPDLDTAKRIFALADGNGTPCCSTSALRFADEYRGIDTENITAANFWGPMNFEIYSVHQLEPLVMLMKCRAESVMMMTAENYYLLAVRFADGREHFRVVSRRSLCRTADGEERKPEHKRDKRLFYKLHKRACRLFPRRRAYGSA